MAHVTGIELGPNYCVLVRTGRGASRAIVAGARAVTPGEWSGDPNVLADVLRQARRTNQLPRRARVVAWGPRSSEAIAQRPEVSALLSAGFQIGTVLSPAQALAGVVRARQLDDRDATAALSLNTHGAAMAIISGENILWSRCFEWPLGKPFVRARSEFLEKYLIISQLAPQLQHLIDLVRPVFGVEVTSAIACGNLPNLRSLMMLLIEEMDLEVETLDSADLLEPRAAAGMCGDSAAALQLASAAAAFDEKAVPPNQVAGRAAFRVNQQIAPFRRLRHAAALGAVILPAAWSALEISGSAPVTPVFPGGIETVASVPAVPELRAEATIGRIDNGARRSPLGDARDDPEPVEGSALGAREDSTGLSAQLAGDVAGPIELDTHERRAPSAKRPTVPLPQVDSIIIAGDRRMAIVDGTVVVPGDRVGERLIARIERTGVVLREPSGLEVHVAIRMRKPGTGGN